MAEMLANPDDKRTKGEKIKAAGLTERTFYRWMSDERYISYVNSLIDKYTSAALPGAWNALVRQCNLGNIAAIKLLFDMKRMNPETNDKRELERERLGIERQKLAILEAKPINGSNGASGTTQTIQIIDDIPGSGDDHATS